MAEDSNKHLTPVWIVYVEGKRLDTDHEGALKRITVDDCLNGIGRCTLLFDSSAVKLRDAGTLELEKKVSIHMGYKDDADEVFCGEITKTHIKLNEYGHEELEVCCCNALYKLKHGRHLVSYEKKSVSDAVKEIIGKYSLSAETDTFGGKHDFSTETEMTDYEYVMRAASKYGKEVYAYDTKVYVKGEVSVSSEEIIYEWGKSLISFEGSDDIEDLLAQAAVTGWNMGKCESFSGNAAAGDVPVKVGGSNDWTAESKQGSNFTAAELDRMAFDADDAKSRALGILQRNSFRYMYGTGKGEGNYKLHPGMRVSIKYAGDVYSGEYIAESVTHRLDVGGAYTTSFSLKRNMKK
jgi:phage protein D